MQIIGFILNLPYTLVGQIVALVSVPTSIRWHSGPHAFIFSIKSFWWAIGYMKGARAAAIGHVVLLGPKVEYKDLEHELIHVRQHERMPLIQPILYYVELFRKGYKDNRYEKEAYRIAGNTYKEFKTLKFAGFKAQWILDGTKTASMRLFDDKDLRVGDILELVNSDTGGMFSKAVISEIIYKKLGEIKDVDLDGHEKWHSHEEMLESLRKYYGNKITLDTEAKIVRFKALKDS